MVEVVTILEGAICEDSKVDLGIQLYPNELFSLASDKEFQ